MNKLLFKDVVKEDHHWKFLCEFFDRSWSSLAFDCYVLEHEMNEMKHKEKEDKSFSPVKQILERWQTGEDATISKFMKILKNNQYNEAYMTVREWIRNSNSDNTSNESDPSNKVEVGTEGETEYQQGLELSSKDPHQALALFKTSLAKNYPPAIVQFVRMHREGFESLPIDKKKANQYANEAKKYRTWFITQGLSENLDCKYRAASFFHWVDKDYIEAILYWKPLAESGNVDAQCYLGRCYLDRGPQEDTSLSHVWIRKAAEQQHPAAMYYLGRCYFSRRVLGNRGNRNEAVEWFEKSAMQGFAKGQSWLGDCYVDAFGTEQNYDLAAQWLTKAAEKGNPMAQSTLGSLYYNGDGVPQDFKLAVEWYQKAVAQDYAPAFFRLANCYFSGNGVEKDINKAVPLYKRAALEGNTNAQYMLGRFYDDGLGEIESNKTEAARWFQAAARKGHTEACYMIGVFYGWGLGVPKNYEICGKWLGNAAYQKYEPAMKVLRDLYDQGLVGSEVFD